MYILFDLTEETCKKNNTLLYFVKMNGVEVQNVV